MKPIVLVADGSPALLRHLEEAGYQPVPVPVPEGAGADLLRALRAGHPDAPLVAAGAEEDAGTPAPLHALGRDEEAIRTFEEEERDILSRALQLTGWNVKRAAERLKLGRATLYRKIERYGLRRAS